MHGIMRPKCDAGKSTYSTEKPILAHSRAALKYFSTLKIYVGRYQQIYQNTSGTSGFRPKFAGALKQAERIQPVSSKREKK